MSRDVKYIGMDVHKEAVVITVPNSSGRDAARVRAPLSSCKPQFGAKVQSADGWRQYAFLCIRADMTVIAMIRRSRLMLQFCK